MSEYTLFLCEMGIGIHTTWVIMSTASTSPGTFLKTQFLVNVDTDVVSLYKLHVCKWPFLALSTESYTQDPDLVSKCHSPLRKQGRSTTGVQTSKSPTVTLFRMIKKASCDH